MSFDVEESVGKQEKEEVMWMVGVNDGSRVVTTRVSPARGSRGTLFSSLKLSCSKYLVPLPHLPTFSPGLA